MNILDEYLFKVLRTLMVRMSVAFVHCFLQTFQQMYSKYK